MVIHQPDHFRNQRSDHCSLELKQLGEIYAIRARELSDAVATLGLCIAAGQEFHENIMEVKRLRILAQQASEELLAAIEPAKVRASAA